MTISKGGIAITNLELWRQHGGPKHDSQWVEGRSAMELARAWLESGEGRLPLAVQDLFTTSPAFGPILEWQAEPEVRLSLDDFAGEPRNTDLLVRVKDAKGPYLIAVEGKADEPFSDTVAATLSAGLESHVKTKGRSNRIRRVEQLASALFQPWRKGEPGLGALRYQLLTATAGALKAAKPDESRVVLLIHEFETDLTADENHETNTRDLDRFVTRLSGGAVTAVPNGAIVGPFLVPAWSGAGRQIELHVAKIRQSLRRPMSE